MQKRQDPTKSIKKVKKEATQEFFNKKRSTSEGTQFTFNKAPINKAEAKKEFKEERERKSVKRSAFTAKLYRDDNELDEMKVLAGDQFDSDIDEQTKPRDAKAQLKKQDFSSKPLTLSKIGRLHLAKGSVAMFAVREFHKGQYAVVNHTRNVKGYLDLKTTPELTLQVGQLVVASVTSVGLGVNEKGSTSKKLQLSIDPSSLYRSLSASKVTPGMFLQAVVESKEEKGYFLNLGFKDEAKGFVKFDQAVPLQIGSLVHVTVLSASSKLVKCQTLLSACVQSTETVLVNEHTLKAGFLVNAKIAKIYENGVEISFLGGMTGTVFIDHLGRENPTKFKVGEKVQARCISHDVQTKLTNLSLLSHIIEYKSKPLCEQGAVFEKCKVLKITYGGSYHVKIGNSTAFLHKSHLPGANKEIEEEDPDKKKKAQLIDELVVGQVVDKVRVKELNYFDGIAHVTMRSNIVNTVALEYNCLEVGQFVNATIDSVAKSQVTLSLNEFVKGVLKMEHMADYPLKQIPPKFTQTGKQIKVRVFAVDERQVIFTKKESLMKHNCAIYKTIKEVKKGDKVHGVVVAQNEHGFIIKSFGEVKGLLTFAENKQKADLKVGSFVKTYVLFNKKGKGLALTLDKKKARENKDQHAVVKSLAEYLPTDEELSKLKEQYSSYMKHSADCVSQKNTYKVVETHSAYYVLKTVLDKKTKFGILPKPMSTVFGLSLPLDQDHFTFEGFVAFEYNKVPIISLNPVLDKLKDCIPTELVSSKLFVGIVEQISSKLGLIVKFPTFSSPIAIKDLQHSEVDSYKIGQVLLVAQNKAGRLSCKDIVLNRVMTSDQLQQQKSILLNAFAQLHEQSLSGFKIGQKLQCQVALVKDYGLIVQVDSAFTGFIVNEQRLKQSGYKVGQHLTVSVLDVDYDKKIIDLTEKPKPLDTQVELAKDQYMIVSSKAGYGVCLLQGLNDVKTEQLYSKYHVGDELQVKLVPNTTQNKELQLMVPKISGSEIKVELREGALINGQLKSIKGHCLFVQVGANGRFPLIGRLQKVECPDFSQMQVGQQLSVKVLKVSQGKNRAQGLDHDKQLIELTRRKEHLDLPSGRLNESLLATEFKDGQPLQAIVTDITPELSCPIQIQVSAFVHGSLLFSDLINPQTLQHSSVTKILSAYKVGQAITVYPRQGHFSLHLHDASNKTLKRGDLCVARFVKVQPGFGVTVQLNQHTFGIIETCELSDDIQGCIYKTMRARQIFVARVIDTDKKGRLMLSARESVIENWAAITTGSTAQFQQLDSKQQQQGNLRNKILKFGNKALQANDLFVGYVSNVSKAGCFVQIGHQTTVRIGLNELDDSETFNFAEQMVIARMVCGRITKTMGEGEDIRFNASLRKSIVVHGVGLVNRNQLKTGQVVQALILASSADFAFAQINGSYLKLKVYKCNESIGTIVEVKLTKVEPENIKGDFIKIGKSEVDQVPGNVWQSVSEEARQDILAVKVDIKGELDIESAVKRNAVEQQINDLQTINEIQQEMAEESEGDDEEIEDSDEEAMNMIRSKSYLDDQIDEESGEDDDESGEASSQESGEQSDVEMESESDGKPKLKGKKALRMQIDQEKQIRLKEQQITQNKLQPQSVQDFERLLVSDSNQSFLWIQYMAFMLDKLDLAAARKIAERAVKTVDITSEEDKLNIWIGYLNLENSFGDQQSLTAVVNRALECNDQKKVYLQLVNIYRTSNKLEYVDQIYAKLCKKYFSELDVWAEYLEYLFESKKEAKPILQKSLQALPKNLHINIISKYGMLEYKHGQVESGRTMFEGIVSNYPKRMDIWSIYMDMEVKYSGNAVQARHLFERCLSLPDIAKKPRNMKLVFRKYMEFEHTQGNTAKVAALRQRVEQYLEKAFQQSSSSESE